MAGQARRVLIDVARATPQLFLVYEVEYGGETLALVLSIGNHFNVEVLARGQHRFSVEGVAVASDDRRHSVRSIPDDDCVWTARTAANQSNQRLPGFNMPVCQRCDTFPFFLFQLCIIFF